MKHYSAASLTRLVERTSPLLKEDDVLAMLRRELDGTQAAKGRLAARLGIGEARLSAILRARWPVCDQVAAALGYRRVTRFEKIERPIHANHGRSAERIE